MLDEHAPLKRINKYKLKFKPKPWITTAVQKSITDKNKLLKRFINAKDLQTKETFHRLYKDYRNMLSTLLKKGKSNYYNQYFRANMNNIKNTWKGIKSILTIKNIYYFAMVRPSNIFSYYFPTIAEKTKENINPLT